MNMIDKVARAIDPEAFKDYPTRDHVVMQRRRRMALDQAKAAIKAMREPTEAMIDAVPDSCGLLPPDDCLRAEWQVMIDAALEEGNG